MREHKILIVGGGFGGVRAALDLAKAKLPNTKIILVSDKPHFEYHAALYRVVTGRSPLEVCIPLQEIFDGKNVDVVIDTVNKVDLAAKKLEGSSGSHYKYDFLVLALGSETSYFDIPGLEELSFGFKSITEALKLKRHLHETFEASNNSSPEDKVSTTHVVVIGGGASGTELAGELAIYTKELARKHDLDPALVTIDLVEAAPRLLPVMPEDFSAKVLRRLRNLGVNVFLNRSVVREDLEQVYLKDMEMKTKTVIWTAGIKPNRLYQEITGLSFDKKGRVAVDEFLQAKGFADVFVVGDAAATPYSGMAQTAIRDGKFAAEAIIKKLSGKTPSSYQPKKPSYAIPVGPGWAGVLNGNLKIYGRIGWWLRRFADLRFFTSILPAKKALLAFQNEKTICESCLICTPDMEGGEIQ